MVEAGGKNGVIPADKTTYEYLEVHFSHILSLYMIVLCLLSKFYLFIFPQSFRNCDSLLQDKTSKLFEPMYSDAQARYYIYI